MKRFSPLILSLVFLLFMAPAALAAPAPEDLVGWWKLDEESGTTAEDSSLNPVGGTNHEAIINQDGKFARSYKFDGVNDYVEVLDPGSNSKFDVDKVTLEAWIKLDGEKSGFQNIVRKGHHGDRTYGLDLDNGKLRGFVNKTTTGSGAATIATDDTKLATGRWHHVAMTYDGSQVKIYVNGQLEQSSGSVTGDIFDNNLSVRIGGQKSTETGGALAFKGWIDEVRIWKVALTQEQLVDDGDGVIGTADFCPGTTDESFTPQAVNRWWWNGTNWGSVQNEGKKSKKWQSSTELSMVDTHGCSCTQILDKITGLTGSNMEGHYKYGCSKSVIEDFMADMSDGEFDGLKKLETVEVLANKTTETLSSVLANGQKYLLRSKGTWTNSLNLADAEYASKDGWVTWMDGYDIDPWFLGVNEFDLMVDGGFVDWGSYNPSHEYEYQYLGTGSSLRLLIFDGDSTVASPVINSSWYGDNSGSLTVDIFAKLY